jgi:hypothetical protein
VDVISLLQIKVLQHGMHGSVFFECTLDELQGVCALGRAHAHMCEFKHSSTNAHSARTVAHTPTIPTVTRHLP